MRVGPWSGCVEVLPPGRPVDLPRLDRLGRSQYYFAMDKRAIIFDLDGVLTDSEGLHIQAWQELMAARGLPFEPRWACEWVGVPDIEIASLVFRRFAVGAAAAGLLEEKRRLFRGLVASGLEPFAGVAAELGKCLAASIPMAVGTCSARAEAELMLQVTGLATHLPVVVAGDEVPRVKPAPDIYLKAAALLGIPPVRCLVLEDSPAGIASARAAGMSVFAVPTSFSPDRLVEAQRVFDSPAEAIAWLRSTAASRAAST
jgi:beta-phosphoglucomutase-like phosphatase (HAD superfamily)